MPPRAAATASSTAASAHSPLTIQNEALSAPAKSTGAPAGEMTDGKLPGGKANMEMTLTSERVGDCAK